MSAHAKLERLLAHYTTIAAWIEPAPRGWTAARATKKSTTTTKTA